jgi:hypothetical protein
MVIEEIRKLMLKSTQQLVVSNRRRLTRGELAVAAGQHQQQQSKGEGGQLQIQVWDPWRISTAAAGEP